MPLKSRLVLSCLLFIVVSLTVAVPKVHAQSTSISNLQNPSHVILGTPSASEIKVEYTVTYSGAGYGYNLAFYIWDVDRVSFATGSGTSTPDSCVQPHPDAFCDIVRGVQSSGEEQVRFLLKLASPGTYHLEAKAVLFDPSNNLLRQSASSVEFSILVTDKLSLTVRAPDAVSVTVDGAKQEKGNLFLDVHPGTHTISVPDTVQVDDTTRLRFEGWKDGSTQTTRTEDFQDDATFEAVYIKQYSLTLESSQASATGAGWCDEGSSAQFSVPTTQAMSGVFGILGGKWIFQGWYEEQKLVSTSSSASITMDEPHHLTADWSADYTLPIAILAVVAVVVAVGVIFAYRRRRTTPAAGAGTPSVSPVPTAVGMMFCPNCGTKIPSDSKFCTACGTSLP